MKLNTNNLFKDYNNVRINKKTILLIILGFILVVFGAFYIFNSRNKYTYTPYVIEEPEAPLSQSLITENIIQENSEIKQYNNITGIEYSEDSTKILFLTENNSTNSINNLLSSKIYAQEGGLNLIISDSNGNNSKTIDNNVLDAKFFGNDYVYYQTLGNNSGIYFYNIQNETKAKLIETQDPKSFKNFAILNPEKYFFIQPTTGKMGFGNISTQEISLIDTKSLKLSTNYALASAYQLLSISPNNEYIAVLDKTPINLNSFNFELLILTANSTNINNPIYKTEIGFSSGMNSVTWSLDSKYFVAGDYAKVINLESKTQIYSSDLPVYKSVISPDKTKIFICTNDTEGLEGECFVQNFNGQKIKVTKLASQAKWLDNNKIIMVIGTKLYSFDLTTNTLELVTSNSSEYQILNVTIDYMLIKSQNNILKLTNK